METNELELLKNALNAIVKKGAYMRTRQVSYFKTRNKTDLQESKKAETEFDEYVRKLKLRGFGVDQDSSQQKNLF